MSKQITDARTMAGAETSDLCPTAETDRGGERSLSLGEEIANSISHGLGLVLAIAAVPVLVVVAVRGGRASFVVGVSVFGASMVVLYLASTLYHSITHEGAKRVARVVDHSAIFLLIAGSYTPFTLGVLRGPWGWTLLGIVWGLAAIGLTMKVVGGTRHTWVTIALYLAMGWLALVAIKPMFALIPLPGILLILAGGVAYTAGLGFFAAHRLRYSHFVWHLFVIAGTTCHFFAVLWYAA
ncbi:MAG TPA: hemolysin III family protein [Pyrinomonadaceae bacterium]|nr:hemolysin III family protein [Pyrinomonadaceae bacterium]